MRGTTRETSLKPLEFDRKTEQIMLSGHRKM